MKNKFLCIGLSLLLGVTLLSACNNNSKNVVDNKENKDTIEFDADVWKSKDYAARYNMIDSLLKKENFIDFRYTLQDLTNLLGEPDKTDTLVLETYPTQFGGYQYYYWVDSQKYSGRREWILFSITPQEKVGGYSIDAYGYNDDFNDDVSIELSDGVGEQIPPTGQFKLTIIDEHGYIYDKPEQQYFTPFTEIKLHSYPIMDADLIMYVDGEFYSKQKDIETDDGYIWEYTFTMPIDEATLEFKVEGGI